VPTHYSSLPCPRAIKLARPLHCWEWQEDAMFLLPFTLSTHRCIIGKSRRMPCSYLPFTQSTYCCIIGKSRSAEGAALCRSARCPRSSPSSLRRRLQQECRGHSPLPGARGVLAPSPLLAAQGCNRSAEGTALCRSARCPRFILPSRRRRRQKGSLRKSRLSLLFT
jgi:hypothetical protein